MHQPERIRFLVRIGRQPYVSHAAAIDQFLEIESAERPWNRRFGGARSFRSPKHRIYLARPHADRYWFVEGLAVAVALDFEARLKEDKTSSQ